MWCKRIVSETRETSIQGLVLEGFWRLGIEDKEV